MVIFGDAHLRGRSRGLALLGMAVALVLGGCGADTAARTFSSAGVWITAEVVRVDGHASLDLLISPQDGAQLASRPGVILTPSDSGIDWLVDVPMKRESEENGYFDEAQSFSLPFDDESAPRSIGLEIQYAYCLSSQICIRAETTIEVPRG